MIRKVAPDGVISTVAGTGTVGYSGDGGPAIQAQFRDVAGAAVDGGGNLYIADSGNHRIRKVTPGGIITTVAGSGTYGYSGDGGPATAAQLKLPNRVAVDAAGSLYIAEAANHRVRKVTSDGIITTVAGNGANGYSGDGGPAASASLAELSGLAVDGSGNLYLVDSANWRVRKVTPAGTIITVASNGSLSSSGEGGAAAATMVMPRDMATDAGGNLYLADAHTVRKVTPDGVIYLREGAASADAPMLGLEAAALMPGKLPAAGTPAAVSVTPSSGSGGSGTFQFVVSDTAGYTDLLAMEAVINSGLSLAGACYLRYDRGPNLLWLVNDAGAVFTGPAALGVATPRRQGQPGGVPAGQPHRMVHQRNQGPGTRIQFCRASGNGALGDPLVIALEVTGDLTPTLEPGGKSVLLTSNRSAILRYGGLRAWDANGLEVASRLEVNNREVRLVVEDAGAAYPVVVDPWVQQAQLFASDGAAGFGGSVAIDGNTVVIGATGAAYVFLLSNGTWTQQAKLTVPCDGSAVAVSGNTVVAGGCQDGTGMGSVYVFQRTAGIWTQQAQLSSGVLNDSFGGVVAIDGNSIAVGAQNPLAVDTSGGAYVFVLSGGAWTQQAYFTPGPIGAFPQAYPDDSISISGDTIVVGMPLRVGVGTGYRAYVYVRVGSTWTQQALLLDTSRGCGLSVSVSGDTAVVAGCPNIFEIQTSVYLRTQSTWAPQATFSGVIGPVSVSGDALVSSRYLYPRSAGAWTLQQSLVPVSPSKVSVSGGNLMEDTYWFINSAPNVTVQSNTPGYPFTVSGVGCGSSGPFLTPHDFFWPSGTACTLSFTSPDTSTPGARYTFQGWEDGVATNPRTVIASATPATYVADFTAEYQLTVQASNGMV